MATISEILLAQGRHAADSRRRQGEHSGQMWGNLANIISQTGQSIQREREEAPLRKQDAEIRDLRIREGRANAQSAERGQIEDRALRELFAKPELPSPQELIATVGPERGSAIAKGLSALSPTPQQQYQDTQKTLRDVALGMHALPETLRAEYYPTIRQNLVERQVIKPEDAPEAYDPQWWATTMAHGQEPAKPQDFTLSPGQQRFSADGQTVASLPAEQKQPGMREVVVRGPNGRPVKKLVSEAEMMQGIEQYQEPRAAAADNEPLQTIIGPDGKPVLARRRDAIGKTPASGTSKPASGLEKRALNFFNRAQQADKDLEELEPSIQAMGLAGQARMAAMPNIGQSQEGQSYIAAQRAFTEARLRKDSGAAIPPHEYDNDRKTYFAQPGDSKKTLEDKRRGRAAILASLAFESGQALGEFIGDADEARSVVDGYKARSAKPADGKKKIGRFDVEVEP